MGPSLSVIGRVASALWAWTVQTGHLPRALTARPRVVLQGGYVALRTLSIAPTTEPLSAACMERLLPRQLPRHLKDRLTFSGKRIFSKCPWVGVKSTHISRWALVTKLLLWVLLDTSSGKIT